MPRRCKPFGGAPKTCVQVSGQFRVECFDLATGRVVWREKFHNAATLGGMTANFQDFFMGGAQKTSWFLGLIDNDGYAGVDEDDTMSSHAGWAEATAYQSATRPQWAPLACAAGIITNSSQVVYTATGAMSLKGFFVASNSTKGGTTGTLWATALFNAVRTLSAQHGLRVTYTAVMTGGNA